jgi:predicted PurR-regulated permease PerM
LSVSDPKFKQYVFIATYVILLTYILLNLTDVTYFIFKVLDIISPFTVALSIAFIINIPMKLFEKKIFVFLDNQKSPFIRNLKRPLAIFTTIVLVFGFLIGLILFIIPQLVESVSSLISAIPGYLLSLEAVVNRYISSSELISKIGDEILIAWKDFAKIGSKLLGTSLSSLLTMTLGVTTSIFNFVLSLVIALYMLSNKEKLIVQLKKVLFAFFKKDLALKIIHIGKISNITFYHFIAGQFTEALIIGVLCFIGMSLLAMPYALLISVIISITSLIPVFGAFIGTIPSAFIIFIIDPIKALWFIVFIIVLQQFEGNIIYPRVVGNSIGLSGLWVMFAMVIGGNTFGILGILLGIPIFSVIYQLLRTTVYSRLHAKAKIKSPVK